MPEYYFLYGRLISGICGLLLDSIRDVFIISFGYF